MDVYPGNLVHSLHPLEQRFPFVPWIAASANLLGQVPPQGSSSSWLPVPTGSRGADGESRSQGILGGTRDIGGLMLHHLRMGDGARLVRSEEWPLVFFGFGMGMIWTIASLIWVINSEGLFAAGPLGWLRVIVVLPAFVSVIVGETLYRLRIGSAEMAVLAGLGVASLVWIVGLVAVSRRV